jgi:prophage tail gpP-like protein
MNLKIDNRNGSINVEFFDNVNVSLRYDSVASTFSFSFYYNPENPQHRILAQAGNYNLARLYHNGELLLTGFIISQNYSSSPQKQLISFGGYSVPGVLEDSQIPPSAYPLQNDGLSLLQVAEKLMRPFQIKIETDSEVLSDMNKVYPTTTASETESVKDYLTSLATQRNVIISSTPTGRLLFTKSKTKQEPILHFEKGVIGTSYSLSFNGQQMHNEIHVFKQAGKDGGNAGQAKILNPYVPVSTTAFRPKVLTQSSGDDNDTMKVAKTALASELKGISLKINTDRWEINGKIIKPNNIITITDPDLFLFEKTRFFIESVDFAGNSQSLTATLNCVLPEVYSGEIPTKNIFFS